MIVYKSIDFFQQTLYFSGNSWGVDEDGQADIGRGQQEEFYGCSDVEIQPRDLPSYPSSPISTTKSTPSSSITEKSTITAPKSSAALQSTTTMMSQSTNVELYPGNDM